ncbi:uncharacterized protein LOC133192910 [Saccostrea echinata]|uniref:uncharacterized protein LOC133192910 n=1 Tax=Saccostrea echinata TaxID=191078 RepID=UPI002A813E29|nr:uncharacterized protein LOC133192910 [Saccostrea echinata]
MDSKSSIVNFGIRRFECMMKEENRYLMTSDVFNFYGSPFRLGLCWELHRISATQYTYYAAMDVLPNTANARLLFRLHTSDFNITRDCQFKSSYDPWQSRVLFKFGAQSTRQCPLILQANFTYTFDPGNGNQCNANTSLDVCSDTSRMNFNYNFCAIEQGYSATGELSCIQQESHNGSTYLIVYNNDRVTPDEINRFRFTCYVMQQDKSDSRLIHVTQYPQACLDENSQSPHQVLRPGAYLKLHLSSQAEMIKIKLFCVVYFSGQGQKNDFPSDLVSIGAISAVAGVCGIFVLILSSVCGVKLYKKYKTKSVKPVRSQSVSSIDSFDRVQSMFSLDGRISPFSLRPTLSEIAYKRFGPSNEEFDYLDEDMYNDEMSLCDSLNDTKFSNSVEASCDQSGLIDCAVSTGMTDNDGSLTGN